MESVVLSGQFGLHLASLDRKHSLFTIKRFLMGLDAPCHPPETVLVRPAFPSQRDNLTAPSSFDTTL